MTHKEPINKRIFENKFYLETTKLVLHAKHPLLRKLVDTDVEIYFTMLMCNETTIRFLFGGTIVVLANQLKKNIFSTFNFLNF